MMNLEKLTQEYYLNELMNNGVEYNEALIIIKDFAKKSIKTREYFEKFKDNMIIINILSALNIIGQDLVSSTQLKTYTMSNNCDLFYVG